MACAAESVQASLAGAYDTDDAEELAIEEVNSSLTFNSSIELSRPMAPLGLTPLLLGNLAGGVDPGFVRMIPTNPR